MSQSNVCTSCMTPNSPSAQLCIMCGAPLNMTRLSSVAQVISVNPGAPQPSGMTLLPLVAGTAQPGVMTPTPVAYATQLVPIDPLGVEDPARALVLPGPNQSFSLGWNDLSQGHMPHYNLAQRFPELVVQLPSGPQVAVSRKTGSLRTAPDYQAFISAHLEASSAMWVQVPGEAPQMVLPGDEADLYPGMFIFLGKNDIGITFRVR